MITWPAMYDGAWMEMTSTPDRDNLLLTFAPWQYALLPDNPVIMSEAGPLGLFHLDGVM